MAREFLSSRGIAFEERNIRTNPEFIRELVEDHRSRSTPTLVVDARVIMGFDPVEYDSALRSI